MQNRNFLIFVLAIIFSGCYTRAFYVSPMYGKSTPYYALPMQKDSVSSSVYLNGSFGILSTNHTVRDEVTDFQGTLYRAHNFKYFKFYYGVEGGIGNYKVARIDDSIRRIPSYLDTGKINSLAGNYFFGNIGIVNGFLLSLPADEKLELRLLGLQFALLNEFGNYISYRQQLNTDSVSGLVKSKTLGSLSLSTGFCMNLKPVDFGLSFHLTWILGKQYSKTGHASEISESHRYRYFTTLWYLTHKKTTFYLQSNLGDRLLGFQGGINYRLSAKK